MTTKIINLKDLNNLVWDDHQFFAGNGNRSLRSCSFKNYEFERFTTVEGEATYYMCLASSKTKFLDKSFKLGGGCLGFKISKLNEKYFIVLSPSEWEQLSIKDAATLLRSKKQQSN